MDEKEFVEVTPADEKALDTTEDKDEKITDRERVESIFENNPEGAKWFKPATFAGILSGIVGVIGNILHVFVSNVLFGKREQLDLRETFQRARRDYDLRKEEKKLKKEEQKEKEQKEQKDKEQKEKEQKEKEQKEQKEQKTISHPAKEEETLDISEETRDKAAGMMMEDKDIQKVFNNLGFSPHASKDGDEIYLLKKTDEGFTKAVYGMSKMDLLKGDAKTLAAAIHTYDNGLTKRDCALQAAITVAAARLLANYEEFEKGSIEGNPMRLSYVGVKVPEGADHYEITGSARGVDAVDIHLNGEVVASMSVDQLMNTPYANYKDKLMVALARPCEPERFVIGDKDKLEVKRIMDGYEVSVIRENGEKMVVNGEPAACLEKKTLGNFPFNKESDVRELMGRLKEENIHISAGGKKINDSSLAYTVAAIANPDMQPERDKQNRVLNTYTGRPEADGKPHMQIKHTEKGVRLNMFMPTEDGKSYDILPVTSWQKKELLTQKDINNIAISIQSANKELLNYKSAEYKNKSYNRSEVYEESKTDYFDVPIVGTRGVVKDVNTQEFMRERLNDVVPEEKQEQEERTEQSAEQQTEPQQEEQQTEQAMGNEENIHPEDYAEYDSPLDKEEFVNMILEDEAR